ncbi:MAG TPA: hypothetical protein VG937_14680 [Polyangiaceae bacterium]|jgi:flagellar motor protein MotB|nr:hypothetical protein [Polyangiaceae bacterium]
MGRNPWDDDPDLQMLRGRSSGPTRWGRVLGGILLVGVATFAGAYYLPLFRAHSTLTAEHRRAVDQIQTLAQSLSETKSELKTVTARKDELEAEKKKHESSAADSSSQLDSLKADLAGRLDKAAKKGLAQVSVGDGAVLVALADAALFTPHKLELSAPGKQLLCEVGKAAEKRQLVVSAADADETADAALTQKYPNAWALRAARAAAAADGLQSKCGATAQLIVKTPGGSAPGNSAFQGSKLPHVHLEFELRAPTR